jgi:hypothetical protein
MKRLGGSRPWRVVVSLGLILLPKSVVASTITAVTNLAEPINNEFNIGSPWPWPTGSTPILASPFTTGASPFALSAVSFMLLLPNVSGAVPLTLEAQLWSDSHGRPSGPLHTLTSTPTIRPGFDSRSGDTVTFSDNSGFTLSSHTTYWLSIQSLTTSLATSIFNGGPYVTASAGYVTPVGWTANFTLLESYDQGTTWSSASPPISRLPPYALKYSVDVTSVPEPAATTIIPHFANGRGIVSDLVLVNPWASPVTGSVRFADDNGYALPLHIGGSTSDTFSVSIPAYGSTTLSTDGAGDLVSGSVKVTAPTALGAVVRFNIAGLGIAGVGASDPLSATIVPVRIVSPIDTGVAIVDAGGAGVVMLTLRNSAGVTIGTSTLTPPVNGHISKFLSQLFPAASSPLQGTLTVSSSTGKIAVVAIELGNQAGQFTTLPVTPLH